MASRIMHLAIAEILIRCGAAANADRFRLGCVMPDAYGGGIGTAVSHFKTQIMSGTKNTYRLSDFRKAYAAELLCDDLYLGYYLHLVQDMLFRNYVYDVHGWNPVPQGNPQRLHNDYALLNPYIIGKYALAEAVSVPHDIAVEKIMSVYPFDLQRLVRDISGDFSACAQGVHFFFTRQMADEFTCMAAQRCREEISALKSGGYITDETEYAWNAH